MANNKMKEYRNKANKTMREVAQCLNISENYVYMLESGIRNPGFKLSKKIADLFGTSVEDIFFDNEHNEMLGSNISQQTA